MAGDHASLRTALDDGADPEQPDGDGRTLLHLAILEEDVEATRLLLEAGADLEAPDALDRTPLASALLGAIGQDPTQAMMAGHRSRDSAPVRIACAVMRERRRRDTAEIDVEGPLTMTMEMLGLEERGFEMVSHLSIETADGELTLRLSALETRFDGMEHSEVPTSSQVILRPGAIYHVVGTRHEGEIEASRLEFVTPPEGNDSFVQPLSRWLPSTLAAIEEHTWLGALTGK